MNETIRVANREGTKAMEAEPASNAVGLGDDAIASVAAAPVPTAIIMTTTKRATYADLTVLVILDCIRNNTDTDTGMTKP